MKFKTEHLRELLLGDGPEEIEVVVDKPMGTSRWSVHHELVIKFEDRYYRTRYSCGATEMQDERPFEYEGEEVELEEVERIEVMVYEYRKKK